jgi:hypothetical protein
MAVENAAPPSGLVSLAKLIASGPADHELATGFTARLAAPLVGGDLVAEAEVTAVLERTAVVALGGDRRGLARIGDVLVDPAAISWRPPPRRRGPWSPKVPGDAIAGDLAAQRDASDERARRDQARSDAAPTLPRSLGAPVATSSRTARSIPQASPTAIDAADGAGEPAPVPAAGGGEEAAATPRDTRQSEVAAGPTAAGACGRCGRPLGGRNRQGVCMVCRTTCPTCGGAKAAPSERCWRCAEQVRGHGQDEPLPAGVEAEAAPAAAEPEPASTSPAAEVHEPQPVPAVPVEPPAEAQAADESEIDGDVEAEGLRACSVCDGPLARQNRRGVCTACQGTCPSCGGPKAVQADRCRACWREEPPGPASDALSFAAAMEDLPEMVRELHEQLIAISEYARNLEDELVVHRSADRRRQHTRQQAPSASEAGRT